MGQVSVTLNNRTYRLACNDGEEPRLAELSRDVKSRVETLAREFGQPADERILLMVAVLLADELMDLREAHEAMLAAAADVLREAAATAPATEGRKTDSGKTDSPKQGVSKPEPTQHDATKTQPRTPQQGAGGGSGHPALPQAQAQAKGSKSSAA